MATEAQFVSTLSAVFDKYGAVRATHRAGYKVGFSFSAGSNYSYVYNTEFERGRGQEKFSWLSSDDSKLGGYFVGDAPHVIKTFP
jgi:hypothetical protein